MSKPTIVTMKVTDCYGSEGKILMFPLGDGNKFRLQVYDRDSICEDNPEKGLGFAKQGRGQGAVDLNKEEMKALVTHLLTMLRDLPDE